MTLRHLILSLGLYAAAFAFAWCVTWALCELHPADTREPVTAGNNGQP